jgi:serine/threonine protein phosphatase 1
MIARLFKRDKPPGWRLPEGLRVYAIGDVHGRIDLLDALLASIEADTASWSGASEIVLLGDYVDRGPGSAAVLGRLTGDAPKGTCWRLLKGNHEAILLDLFAPQPSDERLLPSWLAHGGRETLASYGLPASIIHASDAATVIGALAEVMPVTQRELLASLAYTHAAGDYLFVHAGIRPGIALADQRPRDLVWIREAFLDYPGDHGVHVVHGHSVRREVDERQNRTGIDTGAYATGKLTALVLEGAGRRYLST